MLNIFQLGLVCFRLRGSDKLNKKLLSNINESGKLHMVPANVNDKYVIRFCAVAANATEEDIGELKYLLQVKKSKVFLQFYYDLVLLQFFLNFRLRLENYH